MLDFQPVENLLIWTGSSCSSREVDFLQTVLLQRPVTNCDDTEGIGEEYLSALGLISSLWLKNFCVCFPMSVMDPAARW
jgi:hypothetical protein